MATLPSEAFDRLAHANSLRRAGRLAEYLAAMRPIEEMLATMPPSARDVLFGDDAPRRG